MPPFMASRRAIATTLGRFGFQRPAFKAWEWSRTLAAFPEVVRPTARQGADGLPLPPPILRVRVTGKARAGEFLEQSHRAEQTIRNAVQRAGRDLEDLDAILDFGCGCGRVMRRWAGLSGPSLYGSDYNPDLIDWCRKHLPFAEFGVNGLEPPLDYDDGQFDLVYALSVFTHLTEPLQHLWLAELRRVIKPGGLLLFTTRGKAWTWDLKPEERARYEAGELVVRYEETAGTNLCAVFHPWPYVHERMTTGFELKESLPWHLSDGAQDVHVLERTG
jgi:SAM-dependent methyltransferase